MQANRLYSLAGMYSDGAGGARSQCVTPQCRLQWHCGTKPIPPGHARCSRRSLLVLLVGYCLPIFAGTRTTNTHCKGSPKTTHEQHVDIDTDTNTKTAAATAVCLSHALQLRDQTSCYSVPPAPTTPPHTRTRTHPASNTVTPAHLSASTAVTTDLASSRQHHVCWLWPQPTVL